MSWTNIPNANLAIGAPIRSIDQLALRDNPIAIAEGATGAPRVRAEALNGGQSGSAPIFAARAWVNFDGTTATPSTIRASGNVSSMTRNGTGDHTVNFTTAMQDANYSLSGSALHTVGTGFAMTVSLTSSATPTASSCRFSVAIPTLGFTNSSIVTVSVFR